MDNLDTRVQFTRAALQQSLLRILRNKPIDKVTIKELCDEAKLNRGTFYLHYTTPNDVLMEIEQQFISENRSSFSPQPPMRNSVIDGWCKEFPRYRREDLDYVYDFLFTGSMKLILNWIEDDKGLSTADLARRLDRLGHYCHLAIRDFPRYHKNTARRNLDTLLDGLSEKIKIITATVPRYPGRLSLTHSGLRSRSGRR